MTLILAAGNSDQFIQVSDRRLTANGILKDDESNKAIVFICSNARLSVGFTGLARVGSFVTRNWILATLNRCATPDYIADKILQRFANETSREFIQNPQLKSLSKNNKRLSIMFTGYLYHHNPPLGALAIISNFHNVDTNKKQIEASDEFKVYFREEKRPYNDNLALFYSVGTLPPVPEKEMQTIKELVSNRKPANAIVAKLIELVRLLSEKSESGNTIGRQINSIVIPRNFETEIESGYHSDVIKYESYMPDTVMVLSDKLQMNVSNVTIVPEDKNLSTALSGPKLKPKQPCWCKSGKIYKNCHGKKQNERQKIKLVFKSDE